jgi:hypothetical protein
MIHSTDTFHCSIIEQRHTWLCLCDAIKAALPHRKKGWEPAFSLSSFKKNALCVAERVRRAFVTPVWTRAQKVNSQLSPLARCTFADYQRKLLPRWSQIRGAACSVALRNIINIAYNAAVYTYIQPARSLCCMGARKRRIHLSRSAHWTSQIMAPAEWVP